MPLTRRDEKQPEQSAGCLEAAVVAALLIVGGVLSVVLIVAFFWGINVLAGWVVGLLKAHLGTLSFALVGGAFIAFAGWSLIRLATGHAPGASRRDMAVAVLWFIGAAAMGVFFVLAAFASQAPDAPGF